ncbi:uncharacterized protein LOC111261933 isoform X2 [Varroa jacobsoni]|nr:uncharacterized protein LOC111250462 isoform X2 [Varroa destructor]XP_022661495.1 uncharacterized protein LOC111250462 isoform X2 [Varroa destructor]XP_022691554.1 uncharacterized protein LOC111261933 isoform X2 [Varroa jacobsoni]
MAKKSSAAGVVEEERRKTIDRGGDRLLGSTSDYLSASSRRVTPNVLVQPGSMSSSRCSLDQSNMVQAQDRLQLITCEVDNMAAKLKSVQEVLDTAKDDLSQLRSLVSQLERLSGSKNVENAELKCTLLKTYIEGLNESVKTMPHYYPSKTMFVEAIMALKEALSCHKYVNVVDGEKSQLLRDHERLRNEMRLVAEENEKLKRRHHKDKKTISELMERIGSSARFSQEHLGAIGSSPKVCTTSSPHTFGALTTNLGLTNHHSQSGTTHPDGRTLQPSIVAVSHREEDLRLIEMLRQVKALLQTTGSGDAEQLSKRSQDENSSNNHKDYDNILRRLREAVKSDRSSEAQHRSRDDDVLAMDSYLRIFEKNISLIEQELNSTNLNNNNTGMSNNTNVQTQPEAGCTGSSECIDR